MNADGSALASTFGGASSYANNHDPFWPRIELAALRERLNLSVEVTDAQLQVAAHSAAVLAALEFAQWRRTLRARGFKRLEALDGHVQGRALSRCYRRFLEAVTWRLLFANPGLVCTCREHAHG